MRGGILCNEVVRWQLVGVGFGRDELVRFSRTRLEFGPISKVVVEVQVCIC